jgi:hypothetical protein
MAPPSHSLTVAAVTTAPVGSQFSTTTSIISRYNYHSVSVPFAPPTCTSYEWSIDFLVWLHCRLCRSVLDLDAVVQATQQLSSKLKLDDLLTSLMDLIVTNTGATQVLILLLFLLA